MSGKGFTLHTLARVLKASMTSMMSFFFGQPHLGHLIFEQGSGLRGFTEGEKSKEGLVGDWGGAKTAAKQATCEWCWYLRGFRGNSLLEGSRKICGRVIVVPDGHSFPLGFARRTYSLLLSHSENGAVSLICRAP